MHRTLDPIFQMKCLENAANCPKFQKLGATLRNIIPKDLNKKIWSLKSRKK